MNKLLLVPTLGVFLGFVACGDKVGPGSGAEGSSGGASGGQPSPASSGGRTEASGGKSGSGGSLGTENGGMAGADLMGLAGAGGLSDSVGGAGNAATGGSGAGGGSTELVSVFVAQGHVGRTVLSCDGGRSWVGERSTIEEIRHVAQRDLRCWSDNVDPDPDPTREGEPPETFELDCDHEADPGRGIAFGDGQFLATFGWGEPGRVVASASGLDWEPRLEGTTFGGVAFAQGVWVLGARAARRSLDGGRTFGAEMDTGLSGWNVRRVGSTTGHGERVILVGEAGDAVVSSDGGGSWWKPRVFPSSCGASIQTEGGIVSSGDVWLVLGGDGSACRSIDGGETWEASQVGSSLSSHAVYDGQRFMVWSRGEVHTSLDGLEWSSTPTQPGDVEIGPVATDGAGGLVAVRGGWNVWYADQRFYRSEDGVTWVEGDSYTGGHPIRALAHGRVARPSACAELPP